jgi:hypothetical protein
VVHDQAAQKRLAIAKIESGRVRVPAHLSKKLKWLVGSESKTAWLYLVQAGRCCLLAPADVDTSPTFRALKERLEEPEAPSEADDFEPAEDVALTARLFETNVAPHRAGWRLTLPLEVMHLLDSSDGGKFVFLIFSRGFVEIWAKEFLFEQQRTPLEGL